jgi:IS4 transposase
LLTNRAVTTLAQTEELIDWYRCHWEIETFFHVLKNGRRVEALQLEVEKQELALASTWSSLGNWLLVRLGRVHPELPASEVLL